MVDFITKLAKPLRLSMIAFSLASLVLGCASQNKATVKDAAETKRITDITTSEDAASTIVTVKGNQTLTYTALKQDFPLGVLFHFPETALDNIKTVYYPPENDAISSIRATEIEEDGKTSRVFIALKKDVPYDIAPDEAGLHILFPKTGAPAAATKTQDVLPTAAKKEPALPLAKTTAPPATRLTSVAATPLKQNVVINVKADGAIKNYKSFTMEENPPRIIIDMFTLKSPYKGEQRINVNSEWVSKIRHFGHPDKVRLVLETQKGYLSKYSAVPVDNGLLIYVGEIPATAGKDVPQPAAQTPQPPPTAAPKAVAAAEPKAVAADAPKAPDAGTEPKAAKYDQPAWLNRIDFSGEEAGTSAVIIGTTRPVEYEITKVADKRLQLKLSDTNLPEYRKRALITTRFQSAVDRITPVQEKSAKDTAVIIELREAVPYFVKQSDNVIRVNFSASAIPPRPYEDAKLPAWKRVLAEPETEPAAPATKPAKTEMAAITEKKAAVKTDQPAEGEVVIFEKRPEKYDIDRQKIRDVYSGSETPVDLYDETVAKRYTGEPIALDFYETDIKNVFRILKEISGKNFAIDKGVTGKVTLSLEKPVPWDQVLDLVLKMNQLGRKMEGNIIRIATLGTLAKEEKARQDELKAAQARQKQEDLVTAFLRINYAQAKDVADKHIKPILTAGRGSATVDGRLNMIVLTDVPSTIKRAKEIIQRLDLVTPQVIIEARVVEANTAFTRDLGFSWGQVRIGDISPLKIGDATLDFDLRANNLPAASPAGQVGFNFLKLTGTDFQIIDARLQAAESEGKTNIISSPKIVTLDNNEATIKQGFEVPYEERDSSGNATVRFKNVDLLLKVTPNVTPDDRIVMKLFVTKNDIADQTANGPALSTNEATTELLVDDGETIVIGGIVKSTMSYEERGIPGLRKVGVLGWLFKSQSKIDNKSELLIFITPRIVELEQKVAVVVP